MARYAYEDDDHENDNVDRPVWRRRLTTWALAAIGLGLGFMIPYMLYLNHQVSQRFGTVQ